MVSIVGVWAGNAAVHNSRHSPQSRFFIHFCFFTIITRRDAIYRVSKHSKAIYRVSKCNDAICRVWENTKFGLSQPEDK